MEKTVLVQSLSLSNVKPSQYLDSWSLGNTSCNKLGCDMMDNDSEYEIGESSSNSSWVYVKIP